MKRRPLWLLRFRPYANYRCRREAFLDFCDGTYGRRPDLTLRDKLGLLFCPWEFPRFRRTTEQTFFYYVRTRNRILGPPKKGQR